MFYSHNHIHTMMLNILCTNYNYHEGISITIHRAILSFLFDISKKYFLDWLPCYIFIFGCSAVTRKGEIKKNCLGIHRFRPLGTFSPDSVHVTCFQYK